MPNNLTINKRLNLVLALERGDPTQTVYVHSTPISRQTFEAYFMVMAKAFADMWSAGLTLITGPRIAALLLRQSAEELGLWEDKRLPNGQMRYGAQTGLMPEIRRLTNVLLPGPDGRQIVPWQSVLDQQLLDEEEIAEVEGAVCFFICASAIHRRAELPDILAAVSHWGITTTFSTCMEYISFLLTLTTTGTTLPAEQAPEIKDGSRKPSSLPS